MPSEIKCLRILVKGKVQGVYFRQYTLQKALNLGLKGYVRNLDDGSVEIIAMGTADSIEDLVRFSYRGSPQSKVDEVIIEERPLGTFTQFQIIK